MLLQLKVRRAHSLTEKQIIIPFIHCSGPGADEGFPSDRKVQLKIYNSEINQFIPLATFMLPVSGNWAKSEIRCFSLGSDIYFIPRTVSPHFWVYRGNFRAD